MVPCGGEQHHIGWSSRRPKALEHDLEAETALLALGGPTPECLALIDVVDEIADLHLWGSLSARAIPAPLAGWLRLLPEGHRRALLAERLHTAFRRSSPVVRNSISKLGLVVLSGSLTEPNVHLKFQMTREFPTWDVGVRPWTDKELVLLNRHLRVSKGERLPYLTAVPTEVVARRTIAFFLADSLDDHRILSKRELTDRLKPFHSNGGALVRLLTNERVLEATNDGYRTSVSRTAPIRGQ